jgi:hypothetical protein
MAKSKSTTRRGKVGAARNAEHSRLFDLLDAVSSAKVDLAGTVQVMNQLLDSDREGGLANGIADTIERWVVADLGALDRAFAAAWDGILRPVPVRQDKGGAT